MIRALVAAPALLLLHASTALADWSADFRVTTNPATSVTESDGGRNVIVDEGFVMIVWSDDRDANREIYFRERVDDIWNAPVRLTTNAGNSVHPTIGRFPGEVRVAFQDDRTGHPEIWLKRKILGAWGPDSCLTCDEFESTRPALDHLGVHLVWEETKDGNREIYFRERFQSGVWQPEFRISDDADTSSHPSVASPTTVDLTPSGGLPHVLVVWQDGRDGNLEIYSRLYDGYLASWTDETRVTNDVGASRFPSAAVEGGCADVPFTETWVAWQDDRDGNDEVYLADGADGNWFDESRITTTPAASQRPSLFSAFYWGPGPFGLVICAFPAIAWEERTAGGAPAELRYVDLRGLVPETSITDLSAEAANASLAIDHRQIIGGEGIRRSVVVWEDTRDGNLEVYFSELEADFMVTGVTVLPQTSTALQLGPGRPNPFRASTELTVRLAGETAIDVRIVSASGREVTRLFDGTKPAGTHEFSWNGESAKGVPVAAGTYFAVVSGPNDTVARRIVRLR